MVKRGKGIVHILKDLTESNNLQLASYIISYCCEFVLMQLLWH